MPSPPKPRLKRDKVREAVAAAAAGLAVGLCVEINQCVGCTRQFFTKSFLGDDAAVLARSSGTRRKILISTQVGLMMTALSALITAMFQCRTTWAMNFYEHSHHWWRALMRFLILGMTYCLVASSMTAFLAPRAAGSGLPEIKGFLNGSKIKGLWQLRVFVVKFFAIALAIGAGLPVGREGPAVFLGASLAPVLAHALWRHGHRIWHGGLLWHGHQARDAEHKRLYATIGGAAGIASAFGAPIGGVLYVFEEISSYWDERKTVLASLCTAVAVLSSKWGGAQWLRQNAHFESLVIFSDKHGNIDSKRWRWIDIPFLMIVSALTGLQAAALTKGMLYVQRSRLPWIGHPRRHVLFTLLVCAIILAGFFAVSLLGKCQDIDRTINHEDGGDKEHHRRFNCKKGQYNDLASLLLIGAEGAIKNLLSRLQRTPFAMRSLVAFVLAYGVGFMALAGVALPMGTFVPNLVLGAATGRLFGTLFDNMIQPHNTKGPLSNPGLYALCAAGAQLGGFTRVSLTVTSLLIEATGDVSVTPILMICALIGEAVAGACCEPYDEVLLHMRRIPYLDAQNLNDEQWSVPAGAVCAKSAKLPASASTATVSAALASERYAVLDHFLVIDAATGRHIGVASRRSLQKALGHVSERKRGDFHKTCTRIKEDVSAHPVLGHVFKPFRPPSSNCDCGEDDDDSDDDDDEEKQDPSQRTGATIDVASLADRSPHTAAADAPMSMVFSLFSKLQLRCVVVIASNGTAAGILERVHLMQLSVTHLERLARAAGEHDSVRRLPGTTEGSLRDLELRAAILGYGPDAGDDSPLPLVQPRAVAMRTRSL